MGLGYSLNMIYPKIKTKFVFYCQDDWEFLIPVPAQQIIDILDENPLLSQLVLGRRSYWEDFSHQLFDPHNNYAKYRLCYSLNPHFARYDVFLENYPFPLYDTEWLYKKKLNKKGLISGIFGCDGRRVFLRHIGEEKKAVRVGPWLGVS
jgi:hypothetical protein